ncbi:BolA/IbaG family iron-sulfur metabolism protein [Gammaproteobacteria bacterium]|nr:BolA/IbaG family iron-sulfur metabolism protein [Gammaproteobacteria bacterium]
MDTDKIKNLIESSLEGSIAEVNGGEGKYNANIIFDGFKDLNTVNRHKIVYSALDSYIKSGELHAISLKTFTNEEKNS